MMAEQTLTMDEFNTLAMPEATEAMLRCCGSGRWAGRMLARRPYASFDDVLIAADESFAELEPGDWLEAFSHHPKIGDLESLRTKFATTAGWASGEQAGVSMARETTLAALAEGNRAYEEKFGYTFIVCATGKSADDMLELLERRLPNEPEDEIQVAAAEQMKITHLRLHKLFGEWDVVRGTEPC
jgi:2-oxo-4-hydroxy-4-carboxy-5-ureidoimidazoline decarboxylase